MALFSSLRPRLLLILLFVSALCHLGSALDSAIERRASNSSVSPISFPPAQNWDGIDGSWSSFTLRVGTPAQVVRVLASWQSPQTWVVHPAGCSGSTETDCSDMRGGIFNMNKSTTWQEVGLYALGIEDNLGLDGNAYFGYDTVSLAGYGEGGPTLQNTTVGNFAYTDFYVGLFGLNPKPTNFTTFANGAPSYMTQLKDQQIIPSVSFGYTAGAPYRFSGVLASLTLGGYDRSRYISNDVEFKFGADNSRDTLVAIQSITASSGLPNATKLLPEPVYALVDASVPHLWLPLDACQAFEREFGLTYDNTTELYLLNSSLHNNLLARDANVTFTLATGLTGGSTVDIVLPYAAFDLVAKSPYQGLQNDTNYFPLKRAQNSSQYTLGRTFMQEAYVAVDYERARFNLSQVAWAEDAASDLIAIPAASAAEASVYSGNTVSGSDGGVSSTLSAAEKGGIIAGILVLVIILAGLGFWFFRRRKQKVKFSKLEKEEPISDAKSGSASSSAEAFPPDEKNDAVFPKAELEAPVEKKVPGYDQTGWIPETPATPGSGYGTYSSTNTLVSPANAGASAGAISPGMWAGEADSNNVYEMMGDIPDLAIADSKQITEKDMMKHRERQYNGVDPIEQRQQTIQEEEESRDQVDSRVEVGRQRRMVDASEVRMATEQQGGNRRFSFVTGDDTNT